MAFYQKTTNGYLLRVRLTPNSSFIKTNGTMQNAKGEEYLKISVLSVAEKGKAHKELIDFLSNKLDVAKSFIYVVSGHTDRFKKICVETQDRLDDKFEEMKICQRPS